ncbi:MAG TPA: YciI family protein [Chloroflexota bacterium]
MSRFVLLLRGGSEEIRAYSPEQFQDMLTSYSTWIDHLRATGKYQIGEPLQNDGRLLRPNGQGIVEGPYTETKEAVGGFVIVEAGDYDEAVQIAHGCPRLTHGGFIEVREIADELSHAAHAGA